MSVSPDAVASGKLLFEKQWTSGNPSLGHDGLGPLFNAASCADCHHQGGTGGSGDATRNAVTVGIEKLRITGGPIDDDVISNMVKLFHPGFIQPDGLMVNTLALHHHGGTPSFQQARELFLSASDAVYSNNGGPADAPEVRMAVMNPIHFKQEMGGFALEVNARVFSRNTPALFGSGLIDQVPDKLLKSQVNAQKRHPEISGRLATLPDGRIGKFGWRGNIATLLDFNDQACAAELGLKTKRKEQPLDPTLPHYRNPTVDIDDNGIRSLTAFVSALPTPTRMIPRESEHQANALRGEQQFAAVGCAICHVPQMGPAQGIYSDLLLHDMGPYLYDLNHAEPEIIRITPVTEVIQASSFAEVSTATGSYGGQTTAITLSTETRTTRTPSRPREFLFVAPSSISESMRIVPLGTKKLSDDANDPVLQKHARIHLQPTLFNQEWRTPPLWGLRDSAPYMHDGRAETVLEAIAMHDGEAAGTRDRFLSLPLPDRQAILAFLDTFVAQAPNPIDN
ncbi:di-heme oxidoredictase family protein [Stieleria varia]|nr:di-heme oxidoredictase family protein [Stieleria varia]